MKKWLERLFGKKQEPKKEQKTNSNDTRITYSSGYFQKNDNDLLSSANSLSSFWIGDRYDDFNSNHHRSNHNDTSDSGSSNNDSSSYDSGSYDSSSSSSFD